jgi:hypothetical protein
MTLKAINNLQNEFTRLSISFLDDRSLDAAAVVSKQWNTQVKSVRAAQHNSRQQISVIPADLIRQCLAYLDVSDLARASSVSREWQSLCNDEYLCQELLQTLNKFNIPIHMPEGLTPKQQAVHVYRYLSQFQLLHTKAELLAKLRSLATIPAGQRRQLTCVSPYTPSSQFNVEFEVFYSKGHIERESIEHLPIVQEKYLLLQPVVPTVPPIPFMARGISQFSVLPIGGSYTYADNCHVVACDRNDEYGQVAGEIFLTIRARHVQEVYRQLRVQLEKYGRHALLTLAVGILACMRYQQVRD